MQFCDLQPQQARIRPSLDRRIAAVLAHGQYVFGPEVAELEAQLAAFVGVRHCVTVASGTDALLAALMALGIGPGDEVITSSFSFAAGPEMIQLLGARPVFADIGADGYNLDPAELERLITPRTRAILPADLFGHCADHAAIQAVAAQQGLPVIADAAQSFGARRAGRAAASYGDLAITSFYPSKPLGAYGDGGACFTDRDDLAEALRAIRNHGQSGSYRHLRLGLNSRLDTLQAAILLAKLEVFASEIPLRQAVAARYRAGLAAAGHGLQLPPTAPDSEPVWAQFTIEVADREALRAALTAAGIPTAVHYPEALHRQPAFRQAVSLPRAERAASRVLSLPFGPYLDEAQQQRVIAELLQRLPAAVGQCRDRPDCGP